MANLSYAIRSKPNWTTKINDPVIRRKWREEALGIKEDEKHARLTEKMVDWVLAELDALGKLTQNSEADISISCFDGVFESSNRIPPCLRDRLLSCVAKLEDVSDDQKDWHPGSDNQVLDIDSWGAGVYSTRFCWIPTDFEVSNDGKTVKAKSYINNLHPKDNQDLYKVIEEVLALSLPLLSSAISRPLPKRIGVPFKFGFSMSNQVPNFSWYDEDESDEYYGRRAEEEELAARRLQIRRKTIQVIIKLANIYLAPENPTYPGGAWHLEGMSNENIVASCIYYYGSHNVTDSYLAFRSAFNGDDLERGIGQDDVRGPRIIFGVEKGEPCVQPLGAAHTTEGVLLAWPNGYQHRLQSFSLLDKSKPGHRKILAFFLVHPEEPIPSTTAIPPQRFDWALRDLEEMRNAVTPVLPIETWDKIKFELKKSFIDFEEAKKIREQLMKQRTNVLLDNRSNYFNAPLSLCEH
ncbi:hypothetical protein T439DRAFT_342396 [Meredithblackwellia eburnea MCA 4105]